MPTKCTAKKNNGERCGAWAMKGKMKCPLHWDPGRAAELGAKRSGDLGCTPVSDLRPVLPPKSAGDVRDALAETMARVQARKMDTKTANTLAYVGTSLLRAIEVSDLETRLKDIQWQLKRDEGDSSGKS